MESIFSELGLSMSTATTAFYRQVIRYRGMPFDFKSDPFFSEGNMAHLKRGAEDINAGKGFEHELREEIEEVKRKIVSGEQPVFDDTNELFDKLDDIK